MTCIMGSGFDHTTDGFAEIIVDGRTYSADEVAEAMSGRPTAEDRHHFQTYKVPRDPYEWLSLIHI